MTYAASISQGRSVLDTLRDNAKNTQASEKTASAFSTALNSPLLLAKTTIIELDDGGPGHAALHIDNDGTGQPFLYDPAGSFLPKNGVRGGDILTGEDANLQNYVNYWQSKGDTAHLHKLETDLAQEQAIMRRAEKIGNASPPLCATSVSGALGGVCGVESSIFPSTLGENVDAAKCK